MASVVNALRNIISDKMWLIKLAIFTAPVFYILEDEKLFNSLLDKNIPITVGLYFLYMGIASVMIHRNITNKSPILPGIFDIPLVIFRAIGSGLMALPGSALLYFILIYMSENFHFEEEFVSFLVHIGVVSVLVPFIIIPVVLYSANGKFSDGLRISKVIEGSGNFIVEFLSFVIQYIFVIFIFAFLIGQVFKQVFGPQSLASLILTAFVIVLTFLLLFSFASDTYEDVIPAVKSKRNVS